MTTIEIHFLGGTIGYAGAAGGKPYGSVRTRCWRACRASTGST